MGRGSGRGREVPHGPVDRAGDATACNCRIPRFSPRWKPAPLLVNDGKIRLTVNACGKDFADCTVTVGGTISNRKGVNVPDVVLPLAALSEKDRGDLEFACELGVDWLALSFVQRPEDVIEARSLAKGRAAILSKIEKPAAVKALMKSCKCRTGSWWRAAIWAWNCPSHRCRRSRSVWCAAPRGRQAGDRGHADAGIDDRKPDADPRRGQRRGHRDL
jgi:hypothetical protein